MVYPFEISKWLFEERSRPLPCREVQAEGLAANFECGCVVRFAVEAQQDSGTVRIGYSTNGCGYMRAAAAFLTSHLHGRCLRELDGLPVQELRSQAEAELGRFPPARRKCLEAVIDGVHKSFADLHRKQVDGSMGEKALICTCFGIVEERIEEIIVSLDAPTFDDVKGSTNAGRGCGSCQMMIEEMLGQARRTARHLSE